MTKRKQRNDSVTPNLKKKKYLDTDLLPIIGQHLDHSQLQYFIDKVMTPDQKSYLFSGEPGYRIIDQMTRVITRPCDWFPGVRRICCAMDGHFLCLNAMPEYLDLEETLSAVINFYHQTTNGGYDKPEIPARILTPEHKNRRYSDQFISEIVSNRCEIWLYFIHYAIWAEDCVLLKRLHDEGYAFEYVDIFIATIYEKYTVLDFIIAECVNDGRVNKITRDAYYLGQSLFPDKKSIHRAGEVYCAFNLINSAIIYVGAGASNPTQARFKMMLYLLQKFSDPGDRFQSEHYHTAIANGRLDLFNMMSTTSTFVNWTIEPSNHTWSFIPIDQLIDALICCCEIYPVRESEIKDMIFTVLQKLEKPIACVVSLFQSINLHLPDLNQCSALKNQLVAFVCQNVPHNAPEYYKIMKMTILSRTSQRNIQAFRTLLMNIPKRNRKKNGEVMAIMGKALYNMNVVADSPLAMDSEEEEDQQNLDDDEEDLDEDDHYFHTQELTMLFKECI